MPVPEDNKMYTVELATLVNRLLILKLLDGEDHMARIVWRAGAFTFFVDGDLAAVWISISHTANHILPVKKNAKGMAPSQKQTLPTTIQAQNP